ncbi:hypothetical protein Vadar_029398 [Vaccinium darrowii]|uniref:Uncharacterized protein n=1 Tax=Vaccinium darrowii TaxID=229202 RepID=A0ACB7Y2G2_9ERIC|nr:hypothetical protein Vadar_029398 [Vaccinium darrowii]
MATEASKSPFVKQMMKNKGMAIVQELPEEVLMEILSRIPAKSLLRFKSVSKYWLVWALLIGPVSLLAPRICWELEGLKLKGVVPVWQIAKDWLSRILDACLGFANWANKLAPRICWELEGLKLKGVVPVWFRNTFRAPELILHIAAKVMACN